MKSGILYLIPTPIDEESKLNIEAYTLLMKNIENNLENSIFVVEDLKPGRKRWLNFGLPRALVDSFVLLNEHTAKIETTKLILELKKGKSVFVMSDGGLPAFCDPGRELVYEAHKNKIKVTATPFFNSVILALALSGFAHQKFLFEGFLPLDNLERKKILDTLGNKKMTTILMDTPYRLKRLLEELAELNPPLKKEIFLALDLNTSTEELFLGFPKDALKAVTDLKREFILIVAD